MSGASSEDDTFSRTNIHVRIHMTRLANNRISLNKQRSSGVSSFLTHTLKIWLSVFLSPDFRICTYVDLHRIINRPFTTFIIMRTVSTDMLTAVGMGILLLSPISTDICAYVTVHRIIRWPLARPIPKSSASVDVLTISITPLSELRPDSAGRCQVPSWLRTLA